MPHFRIETNVPRSHIPSDFVAKAVPVLAKALGKPEQYCVVSIIPDVLMSFAGTTEPCAIANLMSIGALGVEQNKKHAKALFELVESELGIKNDRPRNPIPAPAPPPATARDVERALEQQRKLYEQKMKDLLLQSKRESAATTSSNAIQSTVTKPLQKLSVVKPAPSRSLPSSSTSSEKTSIDGGLESQRSPYSFNQTDLQGAGRYSGPQGLYPNLDSGYSTLSPGHTVPSRPAHDGFVYVNNTHTNPPQVSQPQAQRFHPSAPPAPSPTVSTNSRSQSRQRGQDDDIKCPTCGQNYGEKIFQCNQGHSSCSLCQMRQVLCGHCRMPITSRRNFDLEKYVGERRVKCPNAADGCCLTIKISDMETHARECPFKAMQCPSLGSYCHWNGKLSQLSEHFDDMHPTHRQGDVDKEMFLSNITNTSHTMHYIKIGPFNFLFHVKVYECGRIYMAVQLIGTKHSAAKWNYEIHIYNKSEPRRKYQYMDRCLPYSESIEDIVNSTKCAVIPREHADTFVCGGVMAYKCFIKKDEPNKEFNRDETQNKAFGNKKKNYNPRRRNTAHNNNQ